MKDQLIKINSYQQETVNSIIEFKSEVRFNLKYIVYMEDWEVSSQYYYTKLAHWGAPVIVKKDDMDKYF
jgi:hypothetical protein